MEKKQFPLVEETVGGPMSNFLLDRSVALYWSNLAYANSVSFNSVSILHAHLNPPCATTMPLPLEKILFPERKGAILPL